MARNILIMRVCLVARQNFKLIRLVRGKISKGDKQMNDFYIEAKKRYEKYPLEDLYEIFENFDCDFYGWPEVLDALRDTIKEKEIKNES